MLWHPSLFYGGGLMINTVLIVGFHRSGTSLLTGILYRTGFFYIGEKSDIIGATKFNPYGHFENVVTMNILELCLTSYNFSWISGKVSSIDSCKKILNHHIKNLTKKAEEEGKNLLIKDPRLCLFPDILQKINFKNPVVIVNTRNIQDIINSISRRDNLYIGQIKSMIQNYNEGLNKWIDNASYYTCYEKWFNPVMMREQYEGLINSVLVGQPERQTKALEDDIFNKSVSLIDYSIVERRTHGA